MVARDRIKGEMDKKDRNKKVQDNTSTFTKKCLNKTKNHWRDTKFLQRLEYRSIDPQNS